MLAGVPTVDCPVLSLSGGDDVCWPPHLVKDQQRVAEHPAPIGPVGITAGMDRNTGLNPVDELVPPEAKELTNRGETRHLCALVRRQALAEQLKGVALERFAASIAVFQPGLISANTEHP